MMAAVPTDHSTTPPPHYSQPSLYCLSLSLSPHPGYTGQWTLELSFILIGSMVHWSTLVQYINKYKQFGHRIVPSPLLSSDLVPLPLRTRAELCWLIQTCPNQPIFVDKVGVAAPR